MINYAALTDVGRKRPANQDSIGALPEIGLFIVADGMGGHKGGETASQMTVEIISEEVRKNINKSAPERILKHAFQEANQRIFEKSQKVAELRGMGTTATVLLLKDQKAYIGQVGDSRCYFIHRERIWQLTRDHSLVEEKLRAKMITRAEMKTDLLRNVITRSVGFDPHLEVDLYDLELHPGDLFLLCSDGLTGQVDDPNLLQETQKGPLGAVAENLIALANRGGGDDNISVILVKV